MPFFFQLVFEYCEVFNDRGRDPLNLLSNMQDNPVNDITCKNGRFIGTCFLSTTSENHVIQKDLFSDLFLAANAALIGSILYRSCSRPTDKYESARVSARISTLYDIDVMRQLGDDDLDLDQSETTLTVTTVPEKVIVSVTFECK